MRNFLCSYLLIAARIELPGSLIPWTTSLASAARTLTALSTANATPATSRSAAASANINSSDNSTAIPAAPASQNERARRCIAAISPSQRLSPSWSTWPKAMASARPDASSASTATPSSAWPTPPDDTPTTLTPSSWLFPPRTCEVQFDEKWSFVAKKQKNCDPANPADVHKGDWWDHVAYDPEHRLVLAVVPGARSIENAEAVVAAAKERTDGAVPRLLTSDEYPAYASAIEAAFGVPVEQRPSGPGRRPIVPERRLPEGLSYATVHKEREKDRVVAVERRLIFGTEAGLASALDRSSVSQTVNTSFVERQHGTDRGQNARKTRKTYRFSKDWHAHEAMTYYTLYRYNFCWAVRTLRQRDEEGAWRQRTPAMAAGLTDHVWSTREWASFPAVQVA